MEHWMALDCISMSIMTNLSISMGSVLVFLLTLIFL